MSPVADEIDNILWALRASLIQVKVELADGKPSYSALDSRGGRKTAKSLRRLRDQLQAHDPAPWAITWQETSPDAIACLRLASGNKITWARTLNVPGFLPVPHPEAIAELIDSAIAIAKKPGRHVASDILAIRQLARSYETLSGRKLRQPGCDDGKRRGMFVVFYEIVRDHYKRLGLVELRGSLPTSGSLFQKIIPQGLESD
ncbi:hypothetical protein FHS85_001532 [Rhodoligotrophos appendicifer]|uniref:hypothetical protein n=1 Tax=Rhodoligotrophos appendicifer TaxID=987056 RepID=UPI001186EE37|nr:hypothetical protein [Rhodoligotrophos appendicifer]